MTATHILSPDHRQPLGLYQLSVVSLVNPSKHSSHISSHIALSHDSRHMVSKSNRPMSSSILAAAHIPQQSQITKTQLNLRPLYCSIH